MALHVLLHTQSCIHRYKFSMACIQLNSCMCISSMQWPMHSCSYSDEVAMQCTKIRRLRDGSIFGGRVALQIMWIRAPAAIIHTVSHLPFTWHQPWLTVIRDMRALHFTCTTIILNGHHIANSWRSTTSYLCKMHTVLAL